jgi:hypothetical protein
MSVQVAKYSFWKPAAEEPEPDISFTDSRFRRRLSLISRMTIRVLHDIMPMPEETKLFFVSFRGELNQQFRVNKMLIEEGEILPAAFSLSVFNAPPALASMALKLNAGYTALYPGKGGFSSALDAAVSFLLAGNPGAQKSAALVYADESPVEAYRPLAGDAPALAFAALLRAPGISPVGSRFPSGGATLPSGGQAETPQAFLDALQKAGKL